MGRFILDNLNDLVKIFALISNRYSNIKSQIPVWESKPITELEAGEIKPLGTNIKFYTMNNEISKKEKLAMKMYDDYCEAVGGKAWNGDALPKSDEFFNDPTKITQALGWVKAAETAIAFLETDKIWEHFSEEQKRQHNLIDDIAIKVLTGEIKLGDASKQNQKVK